MDQINDNFYISLTDSGLDLRTFPSISRSEISKLIYNMLEINDFNIILNYLISDIDNKCNWVLNIPQREYSELYHKLHSDIYRIAIVNYFQKIFEIVHFLDGNPFVSLRQVSQKFDMNNNLIIEIARSIFSSEEYYERYVKSSAHTKKMKN
jgi:hypothetical protein